jgi:hypothetical protein
VTEIELKQYRSLLREIDNQEKRIGLLLSKEVPVVAGKVKASAKRHPYTEIRVNVQMEDPVIASEIDQLVMQKRKRVEECWRQVRKIEEFIVGIQDSELRQIFEYRYIDGMKLIDIGDVMSLDRSVIGRRIHGFLSLPTKPQNTC